MGNAKHIKFVVQIIHSKDDDEYFQWGPEWLYMSLQLFETFLT